MNKTTNPLQFLPEKEDYVQELPYRVTFSPRWIRVKFGGEMIADSQRAVLLRQYGPNRLPTYYFPPEDVRMNLMGPTVLKSRCPYKGMASYWSARIGDQWVKNIVWSYPEPIPECLKIKGLLCFFNEKVDVYVDGILQDRPQSPWS